MKSGMRLVIGGATLAAVYLLQATPAFTQAPPWAQQQQQRRYYPPQRQQAAPQAQQQRGPAAQQQAPQQQAQPKQKPEPVPQNTQERAACLNAGRGPDRGLHGHHRGRPRQAERHGDRVLSSR